MVKGQGLARTVFFPRLLTENLVKHTLTKKKHTHPRKFLILCVVLWLFAGRFNNVGGDFRVYIYYQDK